MQWLSSAIHTGKNISHVVTLSKENWWTTYCLVSEMLSMLETIVNRIQMDICSKISLSHWYGNNESRERCLVKICFRLWNGKKFILIKLLQVTRAGTLLMILRWNDRVWLGRWKIILIHENCISKNLMLKRHYWLFSFFIIVKE